MSIFANQEKKKKVQKRRSSKDRCANLEIGSCSTKNEPAGPNQVDGNSHILRRDNMGQMGSYDLSIGAGNITPTMVATMPSGISSTMVTYASRRIYKSLARSSAKLCCSIYSYKVTL